MHLKTLRSSRALGYASSFVVAVAVLTSARAARADSLRPPPSCEGSLGADGWIPANAPALILEETYDRTTGSVAGVLVRDGVSTPLPPPFVDAAGLRVVALPPLSAGTYVLQRTVTCNGAVAPPPGAGLLEVRAEVPFPTTVGTAVARPGTTTDGTLDLRLTPTDGMRAFLSVASLRVRVNGEMRPGYFYEALGSNGDTHFPPVGDGEVRLRAYLSSACIKDDTYVGGKQTGEITIEAAIAGVSEQPEPARLTVPVDCDSLVLPGRIDTKVGASSEPAPTASGCTLSAGVSGIKGNAPLATLFTALAAAMIYARRRRPR